MDYIQQPRKKRSWGRIILNILFILSVIANIFMFFLIIGMAVIISSGGGVNLMEETVISGPANSKIAVISLEGVIDYRAEQAFKDQLDTAASDSAVKAVIVKVSSPGGTVTSSDNIHHLITSYKENYERPVLCYMDGIAASGGYYAAVACDSIIASPATITGSIGVIMGHFDVSELFRQKLGITPTTLKSGEKKDWPNMFRELTEEEKVYLQDKIIEPAYQRFTALVDRGRENLTTDQVLQLADGSIYYSTEARELGLTDATGYFEDAVQLALDQAELKKAKVIKYKRPFSLSQMLRSGQARFFEFDRSTVYEMLTPQLMYLWDGRN